MTFSGLTSRWTLLAFALAGCEPSEPAKSGADITHYTGPDGEEWFETACGDDISECRTFAGNFCRSAGYLVGEVRDDGHTVAVPFGSMVVAKHKQDLTMAFRCRKASDR